MKDLFQVFCFIITNPPPSEKEFNELLFSQGNAAYPDHLKAKDFKPNVEEI